MEIYHDVHVPDFIVSISTNMRAVIKTRLRLEGNGKGHELWILVSVFMFRHLHHLLCKLSKALRVSQEPLCNFKPSNRPMPPSPPVPIWRLSLLKIFSGDQRKDLPRITAGKDVAWTL
jgi:hypothetical protein